MVTVVAGNDKLDFKIQGQRVTSIRIARVREDHNVTCMLASGELKIYQPPKSKPVVKPRVEIKPKFEKKDK